MNVDENLAAFVTTTALAPVATQPLPTAFLRSVFSLPHYSPSSHSSNLLIRLTSVLLKPILTLILSPIPTSSLPYLHSTTPSLMCSSGHQAGIVIYILDEVFRGIACITGCVLGWVVKWVLNLTVGVMFGGSRKNEQNSSLELSIR